MLSGPQEGGKNWLEKQDFDCLASWSYAFCFGMLRTGVKCRVFTGGAKVLQAEEGREFCVSQSAF
jgi:hypothetical protein